MSFFSLINLPNLLTLLNLFAGCMAVVFTFNYRLEWVPACVLVSLIADFLDGFAARFTKNSTEIGKQLDSLADMVSFGVVPGVVLFELLFQLYESDGSSFSLKRIYLYSSAAFFIPLFASLRLAKFNLDTRQTDSFIGLATPAVTIFVTGILLLKLFPYEMVSGIIISKPAIYIYIALLSLLMVAELPMFSFKFKNFAWQGNEMRYLFIILSAVLLLTLKFAAVSLIIILYILISLAQKLLRP
ncbi:MAG: CDP-alcohol phosphatidyltransferase family protein [Chitinophagales bacterium]|nr:CDP-alcohol phosphatidyltransferase family protein [Chitinophagales bacterium]